jgi:hypothetical protein
LINEAVIASFQTFPDFENRFFKGQREGITLVDGLVKRRNISDAADTGNGISDIDGEYL